MRDSDKRQYTREWLQFERPQPMYDGTINEFYNSFYKDNPVHTSNLDEVFKEKFIWWLDCHTLNKFTGYKAFKYMDITNGCTQYIDDIYQRAGYNNVMIFDNDYKYHQRLNPNIQFYNSNTLDPNKELLIAMPFPYFGDKHPNMNKILDKCYDLGIPVHIDGAWVSCSRDIEFNFDHPAIKTFCISLSKGGMGGNRIGIRFAREPVPGAISIMNSFNMNSQALVSMGIKFIDTFGPEYFWKKYEDEYYQVCRDFKLEPTKAIHLATHNGHPVGIRPLIRALHQLF